MQRKYKELKIKVMHNKYFRSKIMKINKISNKKNNQSRSSSSI